MASPPPVLGDLRICFLEVVAAPRDALVEDVFESKSLIVSRTRDFRSTADAEAVVGLTGPVVGDALTLLVLFVLVDGEAASLASSRLGKEIGLGILDLEEAAEVGRRVTSI